MKIRPVEAELFHADGEHEGISIAEPMRCTFCIALHVSSTTCLTSGGTVQTTVGILHAGYVSWLLPISLVLLY
jgi:hypothetical protein